MVDRSETRGAFSEEFMRTRPFCDIIHCFHFPLVPLVNLIHGAARALMDIAPRSRKCGGVVQNVCYRYL
jgi:hypothetical protein